MLKNRPKKGPWREGPRFRAPARLVVKSTFPTASNSFQLDQLLYHQTTKLPQTTEPQTTESQTTEPVTTEQDLIMNMLTTRRQN